MTLWLIIHMLDLIWLDVEMVVQVLREVYLAWRHCIFEKPKKWYQSLKSNQLSIKSSVKKKSSEPFIRKCSGKKKLWNSGKHLVL